MVTYSQYDPLELPRLLVDVLPYFDGRPTVEALRRIRAGRRVNVQPGLVRRLVDFGVLVDMGAPTWPPMLERRGPVRGPVPSYTLPSPAFWTAGSSSPVDSFLLGWEVAVNRPPLTEPAFRAPRSLTADRLRLAFALPFGFAFFIACPSP